jgi:hypothetical protein
MDSIKSDNATYSCRYEYKNPDGSTKTISVRECQNGFIICVNKYTPSSGHGDTYKESQYEDKEYISKTNPLMQEKEAPDLQTIMQMCM